MGMDLYWEEQFRRENGFPEVYEALKRLVNEVEWQRDDRCIACGGGLFYGARGAYEMSHEDNCPLEFAKAKLRRYAEREK